jgi:hypothetical protein
MIEQYEPQKTSKKTVEYLGSSWRRLPKDVLRRTEATATAIYDSRLSDEEAQARSGELNRFFEDRGMIGTPMLMSSGMVLVSQERVTSTSILHDVITESSLRGKQHFIGRYSGCVIDTYEDIEGRFLIHLLEVDNEEGSFVVKAPYDTTRLMIEDLPVPELLDPDVIVREAFDILFAVEDEAYREAVASLLEVYEANEPGFSAVGRIRAIGIAATYLLASPVHYAGGNERIQALSTIIESCFDDVEYLVEGHIIVEEIDEGSSDAAFEVSNDRERRCGPYEAITYVTDFNFTKTEGGETEIIHEDGVQPAVQIIDDGQPLAFPLKYISEIREEFFDDSCQTFNRRIRNEMMRLIEGDI